MTLQIITPGRFLEAEPLVLPRLGVQGRFVMRALNRYGRVLREREFDNLVTDYGLNTVAKNVSWWNYIRVGTGTAAPANGDTTLGTQVGSTNTSLGSDINVAAPDLASPATVTRRWRFPIGLAANLTEVGVGASASGADLSTRALIVNGSGVPTAFPIAADEQLEVVYIRGHFARQTDVSTTQLIGATTYGVLIRVVQVFADKTPFIYSAASVNYSQVGTSTSFPAYGANHTGGVGCNAHSMLSYVDGNRYTDWTATWNPGTATGSWRSYQGILAGFRVVYLYDAPIVKGALQTMTLNFRANWGRYP